MSERMALAFEEREYSLLQLDALANGMATVLEHRGVRPGERVALMSSNRPEFVIALRAIWRLGASAVLLSPAWKRTEVEHALALTTPSHAVGDHPVLTELMPMLHLAEPITPGQRVFEPPRPESDAVFVFSSGTTGMPKAVRHTHGSFAVAVRHWRDALHLSPADRMQILTPPSHILGLLNIVMALETGAWIRLHRRFDIDLMLHHIESDRITIEMAVAPIALALAAHPKLESYDLSSLRYVTVTGCVLQTAEPSSVRARNPPPAIRKGVAPSAEGAAVDVRLTSEQQQLREAAAKVADDLGPGSVQDLADENRIVRLEKAVDATGFRTLRSDGASGVEVAIVAEEFARGLVDVPFLGPVLADDLRRLGRVPSVPTEEPESVDLTRSLAGVVESPPELGELSEDDAGRWRALALTVTCADLVGAACGAHALACEYAKVREQYGATIGSYQAVGHLLAESLALIEGSISVLRHAAWAVDELPAAEAIEAGGVAKIYCARAALTVCETSIQVHGGIGNTWECLAHVYLRRALAATQAWPVKLEELSIGLS